MHQRAYGKTGGRKRKTVKKSASKRGGFYGFAGQLAPGAADWSRGSEMAPEVAGRGGNGMSGGRRKSKKGSKKTRKAKRGGTRFSQAVAGYTGTGDRGLANYPDVSAPMGKAAGGEFNNYGAQPGSGFGSFITTSK